MKALWQNWNWIRVYNLSVILFMASLPLSKAGGSLAEGLMALSWFAGLWNRRERQERWRLWTERVWLWGFPSLYLIYVIGGLHSEDLPGYLSELNAKHYWFTIPWMWGTLTPQPKTMQRAWWAFVIANLMVALTVLWIHWTGQSLWEGTPKIPSPWVQRPRASLFLAITILWLVHTYRAMPRYGLIPLILIGLWGLIWMEGRIGQVGLVVGLGWMTWRWWTKLRERVVILSGLGLLIILAWTFLPSVHRPFREAILEIQESQKGYPNSEPEFSSIGMRFTYWTTYMDIFKQHPWIGVGSGDLDRVARPLFQNHPLEIPFHRPHNQWLELGVQQGLPALIVALWAWAMWWTSRHNEFQVLWEAMALIWFLSTWLDCTWSTQAGLSAFMGLNLSLLLIQIRPKNQARPT